LDFFLEKVGSKAMCNECNKLYGLYSLGSEQPRFQTVTGLKNHVNECHKEINDVYLERAASNANGSDLNWTTRPKVLRHQIMSSRRLLLSKDIMFYDNSDVAK